MDPERTKRRQSIKIIISESIMVLAVIITVTILAFLVSGYWINSDFEIERQGLLQVYSTPTGADVSIDGESAWLQRTNTSKVLSTGEHNITLTKDGYDSWTKTINISEGLLYRLHYPRLFLLDRTPENVLDIPNITFATISPDHNSLVFTDSASSWSIINLDSDQPELTTLDVSQYFTPTDSPSEILSLDWDVDNRHILVHTKTNDATEWILLDVSNVKNSINLTKEFATTFDEIKILDNSANNLLVVQDGNLRQINISAKSLSAILIENIIDFDHYYNEIIFSASSAPDNYYIGTFKLGDSKTTKLTTTSAPAQVALSRFYEDKYISILENNLLSLYKKEDFSQISTFELTFVPSSIKVGHNGEFIIMTLDNQIATLDMEAMSITEWQIPTHTYDWLDDNMIYTVEDNNLIVYDYDGLNRRSISNSVSNSLPATITHDKWLYYFNDDSLIRELITN